MRLACAGGGRPLIDAFLDQRPSLGAGTATLRGIAEKMPPPAPTARFGDELVAVFAELVPQAAELYLAGKTDAQQAELAAWTLEADPERKKSYELLRSSTGLHFNAAQGLLGMQSMIWGALDPEARHERNNKDLKMSPAESDLGLATRVGDALGSLSVAMTHTDYGAARAALTLTGESL